MQMSKEVHILKLDDILPNRFQPRILFDEKAINELTESIKEYGVIEPIIVRKVADKYEIIAGERRYKASVLAGKDTIPAIVTDLNDKDSAEIALIENVQRQNLTPIEEAVSYKKILDMGYMNQSELATKLGKTQSTVANKLRLLNLTDTVQEALLQERISERHARSLLRLPKDKQDSMLNRIIQERMTVRKTDEEINKLLSDEPSGEEKTPVVEDKKEEKEEKNMNNNDYMNQFNIPNTPIIENPNSTPVEPKVEPTTVPSFTSPFEVPSVELPQAPVMPEPVVSQPTVPEVTPAVETPISPIETSNSIGSVPTVEENSNPTLVAPLVQTIDNEPATKENEDTPISGRFFNMFGEQPAEQASTPEVTPAVETSVSPEPVAYNPVTPSFDFNPFGPTPVAEVPQTPVMPEIVSTQPVTPEPIPMPNIPVMPEMSTPAPMPEVMNSFQPFQLNDNQEFTNSSVVEMGSFGNNRMEEPALQPLMEETGPVQKVEMKEIINMIRNCAAQIEKNGYTIDTDELDFDDSYQVIFKIEKNN